MTLKRILLLSLTLVTVIVAVNGGTGAVSVKIKSETAPTEYVFAYGTLLDPDVQLRIIGRLVEVEPDSLPGYRAGDLELRQATYLIAVRDPDASISGGVLQLTPSELRRVDLYEGPHYERARVVLESGRIAWVYREWEEPVLDRGE